MMLIHDDSICNINLQNQDQVLMSLQIMLILSRFPMVNYSLRFNGKIDIN